MKRKSLHALIIEDNLDDAELMLAHLKLSGYDLVCERVETEQDMLAALEATTWDIILSDYSMPTFSAMKALEIANQKVPDLPFVIISGTIGEETAVAAMKAGADDYFIKGNLTRLPSAIQRLLDEAEARRERHRAREELRESEERLQSIMNNVKDHAVFMLDPEGLIVSWYPGAQAVFGFTESEVEGQHFSILFSNEGHAQGQCDQELIQAKASGTCKGSTWLLKKNGQVFFAEGSLSAIYGHGKKLRGFVKVVRDITERKRQEEERERLLLESQQANRMKDEFLATLSHELRTPLGVIVGHSELLTSGVLEGGEISDSIQAIQRNAHAQVRLIDDLLDVSRIITGKMHLASDEVNLQQVVQKAVQSMSLAAKAKDIRLSIEQTACTMPVLGDEARLQQVVWNLLSNAIKFTPRGGQVRVGLFEEDSKVVLEVQDTGKGIDPKVLPHIFDRFRQEDSSMTREFGGLGLGLAVVRHLVEMHGGVICAQSEGPGSGSSFKVCLPMMALTESVVDPSSAIIAAEEKAPVLAGRKVLVVDDTLDARTLIKKVISKFGAEVLTAGSAKEALSIIQEQQLDLLICDIGMPEEDGFSLIGKVRKWERQSNKVPLAAVALTGYASEKDRKTALAAGFHSYLAKPVTPALLLNRVTEILSTSKKGFQDA